MSIVNFMKGDLLFGKKAPQIVKDTYIVSGIEIRYSDYRAKDFVIDNITAGTYKIDGVFYSFNGVSGQPIPENAGEIFIFLNDAGLVIDSVLPEDVIVIAVAKTGMEKVEEFRPILGGVSPTLTEYSGTAGMDVGAIKKGDDFQDSGIKDMWDRLLMAGKYPRLVAPSGKFSINQPSIKEVGSVVDIEFSASFDRGMIDPQYSSESKFRSGTPTLYDYSGEGLESRSTANLSDTQTITHEVKQGMQQWSLHIFHSSGHQPKDVNGDDYESPLPSGSVYAGAVGIKGVYPFFGTSINCSTLTKQSLELPEADFYEVHMSAESGEEKQRASFPYNFRSVTGVKFFNTLSHTWEWLAGTPNNSLESFSVDDEDYSVNPPVKYITYTHTGAQIGSRALRFYTI